MNKIRRRPAIGIRKAPWVPEGRGWLTLQEAKDEARKAIDKESNGCPQYCSSQPLAWPEDANKKDGDGDLGQRDAQKGPIARKDHPENRPGSRLGQVRNVDMPHADQRELQTGHAHNVQQLSSST